MIFSLELDLRKLYQNACPVEGSILTKVKGIVSTEDIPDTDFQVANPQIYKRVWDSSDLTYPSYGVGGIEGSLIIVTNLIITSNQTKGVCPEVREN
jgi:hypothetical protein